MESSQQIRRLRVGDEELLAQLWQRVIEDQTREDQQPREEVSIGNLEDHQFYVIFHGEEALGFVELSPENNLEVSGEILEVDNLWVDPNYRNQGVGRNLIHQVLEEKGRQGVLAIVANIDPHSPICHIFYEEAGFRYVGDNEGGSLTYEKYLENEEEEFKGSGY